MPDQPTSTPGPFTDAELAYLADQRLGRMATVQPDGTLQASPVGFTYNADAQAIDIGGRAMASSQKFRNVLANGRVAFVVDDIVSLDLWVVRCLEIRGTAQALADPADSVSRFPGAIIRVHPRRIISWGIDASGQGRGTRDVR